MNTLDLGMLAKELGLVVMDFYLEAKLTLTFDQVVMLRAYLLKWSLWFPYIHVILSVTDVIDEAIPEKRENQASVRYNRTLAI